MAAILLILRPEPGAAATAQRARAMGMDAVRAQLFEVRPIPWKAPAPEKFDAVLLTSANAARHGGDQLGAFFGLPCYAVGEATAEAALNAGWTDVRTGDQDAKRLAEIALGEGQAKLLHLCGVDHKPVSAPEVEVTTIAVYRSEPVSALPAEALTALDDGAITLIHSPRAGALFARLVHEAGLDRSRLRLAAISPAALDAAGPGWAACTAAPEPRDDALLAAAAKLCNMRADEGTSA